MSRLIENGRSRAQRLLTKFAVPVTITRVTGTKSMGDRIAGTKAATNSATTISGRGILGSQRKVMSDGTIIRQAVVTLDVEARKGDRLVIGSRTFTAGDVEIVDPDGEGAIIVRASVE